MIFAFDLDRTIIFSEKAISQLNTCQCPVKGIEYKDGKCISYIHSNVYHMLDSLNVFQNVYFIPVTTRSLEQFRRIDFFKELEYAICANGAIILHNGVKLASWDKHIHYFMVEAEATYKNVIKELENKDFVSSPARIVDNSFVFFKTNDIEKTTEFLSTFLSSTRCVFTIQGNKVYVMHREMSKENALKHICDILNNDVLITAGDGKLDKDMVMMGDVKFVPDKAELWKYLTDADARLIQKVDSGMQGSCKMLKFVKNTILSNDEYCVLKYDV